LLSSGQEFDERFLDSKHVLKVNCKPSRKNKDLVSLQVPILPGWLKILHLRAYDDWIFNNLIHPFKYSTFFIKSFNFKNAVRIRILASMIVKSGNPLETSGHLPWRVPGEFTDLY
jgi:hypothetical protein